MTPAMVAGEVALAFLAGAALAFAIVIRPAAKLARIWEVLTWRPA